MEHREGYRYCFVTKHNEDIDKYKRHYQGLDVEFTPINDTDMSIIFKVNGNNKAQIEDFLKRNKQLIQKDLAVTNAYYTPFWKKMEVNPGPFIESEKTVSKADIKTKTDGKSVDIPIFLYVALSKYDVNSSNQTYALNFENSFDSYTSSVKLRDLDITSRKDIRITTSDQQFKQVRLYERGESGIKIVDVIETITPTMTRVDDDGKIIPGVEPRNVILNFDGGEHDGMKSEEKPGVCWSSKWTDSDDRVGYTILNFPDPLEEMLMSNNARGITMLKVIKDDSHSVLSNWYTLRIKYTDTYGTKRTYPSVEHAYQSLKFDPAERREFTIGGSFAKSNEKNNFVGVKAYEAVNNPNSSLKRLQNLEIKNLDSELAKILYEKFKNNKDVGQKLALTANRNLIYITKDNDEHLGCVEHIDGTYTGENVIGQILMKIRDAINRDQSDRINKRLENDDNEDDSDSVDSIHSYVQNDDQSEQEDYDDDGDDEIEDLEYTGDRVGSGPNTTNNADDRSRRQYIINDVNPDFQGLDTFESLYLPLSYVLSKVQQMKIIYDGLLSRNFSEMVKVNNGIITQMADYIYCIIGEDNFDDYVQGRGINNKTPNSSIIAYLKYAEQRESLLDLMFPS